ncbi:unnamed protein product, partial [Discosporangium mesarthrocarpum]
MDRYHLIQGAVPLGTRKVALRTLDDLALFFVDMRATLLVRRANTMEVVSEISLRTEAFEHLPGIYGPPTELVVCAPQARFICSGGVMEKAGLQDGDLVTHINGEAVSAETTETSIWDAVSVKGVHLLDITFLRATGESSARGYPWHEALAWWQSGVRRHMLDSAPAESHEWMLAAIEQRGRAALWSYRLYREYSMEEQQGPFNLCSADPPPGSGGDEDAMVVDGPGRGPGSGPGGPRRGLGAPPGPSEENYLPEPHTGGGLPGRRWYPGGPSPGPGSHGHSLSHSHGPVHGGPGPHSEHGMGTGMATGHWSLPPGPVGSNKRGIEDLTGPGAAEGALGEPGVGGGRAAERVGKKR